MSITTLVICYWGTQRNRYRRRGKEFWALPHALVECGYQLLEVGWVSLVFILLDRVLFPRLYSGENKTNALMSLRARKYAKVQPFSSSPTSNFPPSPPLSHLLQNS